MVYKRDVETLTLYIQRKFDCCLWHDGVEMTDTGIIMPNTFIDEYKVKELREMAALPNSGFFLTETDEVIIIVPTQDIDDRYSELNEPILLKTPEAVIKHFNDSCKDLDADVNLHDFFDNWMDGFDTSIPIAHPDFCKYKMFSLSLFTDESCYISYQNYLDYNELKITYKQWKDITAIPNAEYKGYRLYVDLVNKIAKKYG